MASPGIVSGARAIDYAALARALCERHQLRADLHAHEVERMLKLPERCWAICCGSGCRPCVDDLALIVRPEVERLEALKATPRSDS